MRIRQHYGLVCPTCGHRRVRGAMLCAPCRRQVYHDESMAIAIGLVRLIVDENTIKEIAHLTHLSCKTIEYHWSKAKRLLNVDNYVGATKLAIKRGWVTL